MMMLMLMMMMMIAQNWLFPWTNSSLINENFLFHNGGHIKRCKLNVWKMHEYIWHTSWWIPFNKTIIMDTTISLYPIYSGLSESCHFYEYKTDFSYNASVKAIHFDSCSSGNVITLDICGSNKSSECCSLTPVCCFSPTGMCCFVFCFVMFVCSFSCLFNPLFVWMFY